MVYYDKVCRSCSHRNERSSWKVPTECVHIGNSGERCIIWHDDGLVLEDCG